MIEERSNLQIDAVCLLIRAYVNQKGSSSTFCLQKNFDCYCFPFLRSFLVLKKTPILDKLMKRLVEICENDVIITARTIQIITSSLNKIVFIEPSLCEKMLTFVNEHRDIVGGDTVAHLLFYLFSTGYEPYGDSSQTLLNDNGNAMDAKKHYLNADLVDFDNFSRIIDRDFDLMPAWLVVQACLALSFYQV